jgi:hypothetical protein
LQAHQSLGHAKSTDDDEGRPVKRPPTEEPAARTKASPAVAQLMRITAHAERRLHKPPASIWSDFLTTIRHDQDHTPTSIPAARTRHSGGRHSINWNRS